MDVSTVVVKKESPAPGVTTDETGLTWLADELGVPTMSVEANEAFNDAVDLRAVRVDGRTGDDLEAACRRVVRRQEGATRVSESHSGKTVQMAHLDTEPSDDCYCWYAAEYVLFIPFSGTEASVNQVVAGLPLAATATLDQGPVIR